MLMEDKANPNLPALLTTPNPPPLTLDAALSTHLETLPAPLQTPQIDLSTPLWSAQALLTHPHLILQTHEQHLLSGAHIITTSSYQATPQGLTLHAGLSEAQALDVIKTSVRLARAAVRQVEIERPERRRKCWVAGSVGPYGAYLADGSEYRGQYNLSPVEYRTFHRGRVAALIDAGADVLALETMPRVDEAVALVGMVEEEFAGAYAWLSFTLRDEAHVADGTRVEDAVRVVAMSERVFAVGVNCVAPGLVSGAVRRIREVTGKVVIAYPNSGEGWDGERKRWVGGGEEAGKSWVEYVREWRGLGVGILGGCCRTGLRHVEEIARMSGPVAG